MSVRALAAARCEGERANGVPISRGLSPEEKQSSRQVVGRAGEGVFHLSTSTQLSRLISCTNYMKPVLLMYRLHRLHRF